MKYIAPKRALKSFTCPHCGVVSRQYHWGYDNEHNASARWQEHTVLSAAFSACKCEHCGEFCLWAKDTLVYPNRGTAPQPNPEMPESAKADYEEAARIAAISPRGAAALLRLAIQKLCVHLGGKGANINDDIALLVSRGLPVQVQQALDVVRVVGNNSVHPGQIDTRDITLAESLFPLVNVIVEYMIDLPKRVGGMYGALPDPAKAAIQKRDA